MERAALEPAITLRKEPLKRSAIAKKKKSCKIHPKRKGITNFDFYNNERSFFVKVLTGPIQGG